MGRSKNSYNLLLQLWPLGRVLNWLGNRPLVGPLLKPCFSGDGNAATIIPVQEAIRGTESVVLPLELLVPFVSRASQRFILVECMCRKGENCQTYPHQIGCLFLGDGAAEINPSLGRKVDPDQALAHARQAMEAKLVPLVVHSSFDTWMLGIPYRRTLAVCFCCDCCCSVRQGLRLGPPAFWDTVVRLPGLTVVVDPGCTGCGRCTGLCPVGAISLEDGRVHIGEVCKGCGRCAAQCPAGAISLHLAPGVDVSGQLLADIEQRTNIGPKK